MKNSTTDCTAAAELFPWYLNGTLGQEEAAALEAHLETCPRCRQEHRETAFAAAAFNTHPTSEQLVRYAFHEVPMGPERTLLEDHLRSCSSCSAELKLVESSRDRQHEEDSGVFEALPPSVTAPLPFRRPKAKAAPATSSWQLGAIAAGLLAVVALGYLMLRLDSPEGSAGSGGSAMAGLEGPSVELPGTSRSRGAEAYFEIVASSFGTLEISATGETVLSLESRSSDVHLDLSFDGPLPEGLAEIEILDSGQRRLWRGGVLEPIGASELRVTLPASALREGDLTLRVRSREGNRLVTVGATAFRVEEPR